jgi:hypothetical protein
MVSCSGNFKRAFKNWGKGLKSAKIYLLLLIILCGFGLLFLTLTNESAWNSNTIDDNTTPLKVNWTTIESDNISQDLVFNECITVRDCNVTFINCNWTGINYLFVEEISKPATATLIDCNVYVVDNDNATCIIKNSNIQMLDMRERGTCIIEDSNIQDDIDLWDNGTCIIKNSNIQGSLDLWENASVDMEDSCCRWLGPSSHILNPVISIRNSTLCSFNFRDYRDQDAQISVVDTIFTAEGWIEPANYPYLEVGGTTSLYMENCSGKISAQLNENSIVTLENCNFTNPAYSVSIEQSATIEANNCLFYRISIPDGNIIITNSEFTRAELSFDSSLDETLQLNSLSANVVLSNFKLIEPNEPGKPTQLFIRSGCTFNISDIRKELLPLLELNMYSGGELYAQNCDIYSSWDTNGIIQARWENCTFEKIWIRSNLSVFSDCTFHNMIDIDTNPYPFGGSNRPCTIENSIFVDTVIHVLTGGIRIDNCDFTTVMGLVWLDQSPYPFSYEKDAFATINNSNPKQIWLTRSTELVASNIICDTIRMTETSNGIFNNATVGQLEVIDSANATLDDCHITDIDFQSPNIQITNSIVDGMAPTLAPVSSPLSNSSEFLLDWNFQPGQNLSGNIASYRIFRANTSVGSGAPLPSEFELVHTIINPDPTYPSDTQFYDPDLTMPSSLDGQALYYLIEIQDQGNNVGNSTILSIVYDTSIVLDDLDAQVLFNDLLTTYDNIIVSVFMIDADINNDGTSDCGAAKLYCTFEYTNGTSSTQELTFLGSSIPGTVYYFEIPQTLNATDVYFSVLIQQSSAFDNVGIGAFDFNSTSKYGTLFHVEAPVIAFTPVSHPAANNILESEEIGISVNVLKHAQYISCVQIHYRLDGGSWITANMTFDPEKIEFFITLPNFNLGKLEYYAIFIDTMGLQHNLLRSEEAPEIKTIIPDFPIKQLEISDLVGIFIGSTVIGVIFSLVYLFIGIRLDKRERLKRRENLKSIINVPGDTRIKKQKKKVEEK